MTTRYKVSTVRLQGGYVAKQCPVRAQNDALVPAEPIPPSPFLERLFQGGIDYEADVVAEILRLHREAVVIDGTDAAAREAATIVAMRAGLSPILNARLPVDLVGRRVGKPDLLVAAVGGGCRAADVKWHQNLEPALGKTSELPGRCSSLGDPAFEDAAVDPDYAARKKEDDLLQLAHYQRMLEAAGLAATDGRWGGIIGTERRIVWYDLDAPIWRTPSATGKTKLRTSMERYDFEFDFRLDIISVAEQHKEHPSLELLVVPVKCSECESCPWWDYCRPQLTLGSGDVSLLPRVGWTQWKVHRDHGVTDRAALAALDYRTASMVGAGVDLKALMSAAVGLPADTALSAVASGKQLQALTAAGVTTASDVLQLDARTAAYSAAGMSSLAEQIDQARAALGPEPVYRRRGADAVVVPRADVEVDIDMENTELGCYQWGVYVTDRSGTGVVPQGYTAFVTWDSMSPEVEAANSLRFWRWLMSVRAAARAQDLIFAAYCWHAGAENQYLRKLGLATAILDEVDEFIASVEWIDLLKVWDSQLITGGSSGLKVVAPLAGFHWEVDDAGGGESMVMHDVAVGAPSQEEREAAREWLLRYNRGDVEATLCLREWIDREGSRILAIESVDPAAL
jgi:predicted RecB family nuclease